MDSMKFLKTWQTKSGRKIIRLLSGRSNVFLLTNGEKNILIDTSVSRSWSRLQKVLDKLGIKSIDYLVLTHAHFDHAANANRIKEKYNAQVFVQKEEAAYLLNGDNILPNGTTMLTRPLINIFGRKAFSRLKYEPCKYDILVDSRLDLHDFGYNAYLLHTPGHTSGSMSLIVDDEIAIVGDCMFGVFKWSVFPPYAQDAQLMVRSWGKLLETGCRIFLPSHGTENSRALVEKEFKKHIGHIGFT